MTNQKKVICQLRSEYSRVLVRTTAPSKDDAESLAKAILNYYSDSQNEVEIIEGEVYTTLVMILVVKESELCVSLQGLDTIRSGFFQGSDAVNQATYSGLKFEVIENKDTFLIDLVQSNRYLLNKVQEQGSTLSILEEQISDLNQSFVSIVNVLQGLKDKHDSFNSYIHHYVDIEGLVKLVIGIADEVDINIDDYYTKPVIQ